MRPCWSGERTGSTTSIAVRCHGRRAHRCDGSISTPLPRKPGGGEQRCLKEAAMRAAGVPFEVWNARRTAERVVPLRMEAGEVAISQQETGILRASRCVRANVRLARARGAEVRENTAVAGFEGTSQGVRVTLADGRIPPADRFVRTAVPR